MKVILIRCTMVALFLSLAGCGLKGPLYFPPEETKAKEPNEKVAKKKEPIAKTTNQKNKSNHDTSPITSEPIAEEQK